MLLTIAIPTYKRCKFAVQNVKHLIPQLLKYQDHVRLIVTDNHSEDGTYEQLQQIEKQYPELVKIYEQPENIGWMNNFFFGIEHSKSEFVFLLGDDDIVSPNFLDIVIPILLSSNARLGMLHFNYLKGSMTLSNESPLYSDLENEEMIVKYANAKEFICSHPTGPSFISSVIFRKACMMKGKELNLQPSTFDYSWYLCLLTGIADYEIIYYKMPICVQRQGGYYPRYCFNYVIGMYNVFKYLDSYIPGVLDNWTAIFSREHDEIARQLQQIIPHRNLYIPNYALFEEALPCKDLKKMLRVALLWPQFLSRKWFAIYSKFHK